MQLTCPDCGFNKRIALGQIPESATLVHCPQCKGSFPLASVKAVGTQEGPELTSDVRQQPKAGFWLRLVAWVIDKAIVGLLQTILGSLLFFAGFTFNLESQENIVEFSLLLLLFAVALNIVYYVVFTSHGGQTPGKMALRIKVIHPDGSDIGYSTAAFREVVAKFISGVILGIGYLMVAFDDQKQGLHDRMTDTYVIKL